MLSVLQLLLLFGVTALAVWGFTRSETRDRLFAVRVVRRCLIAVIVFAFVGITIGLYKAFGAVGGESIDPSQRARILAEGISEVMSTGAFGVLEAIYILILYLFLKRRLPSKTEPGARNPHKVRGKITGPYSPPGGDPPAG